MPSSRLADPAQVGTAPSRDPRGAQHSLSPRRIWTPRPHRPARCRVVSVSAGATPRVTITDTGLRPQAPSPRTSRVRRSIVKSDAGQRTRSPGLQPGGGTRTLLEWHDPSVSAVAGDSFRLRLAATQARTTSTRRAPRGDSQVRAAESVRCAATCLPAFVVHSYMVAIERHGPTQGPRHPLLRDHGCRRNPCCGTVARPRPEP